MFLDGFLSPPAADQREPCRIIPACCQVTVNLCRELLSGGSFRRPGSGTFTYSVRSLRTATLSFENRKSHVVTAGLLYFFHPCPSPFPPPSSHHTNQSGPLLN